METFSSVVLTLYGSAKELPRMEFLDCVSATIRRVLGSGGSTSCSARAIAVVLPHIRQAHAINRCIKRGDGRMDDSVPLGHWAAVSRRGDVFLREDEFDCLLRTEWPAWMPAVLPRPILEMAAEPGPHVYFGRTVVIRVETIADMLVLFARAKQVRHPLTPTERAVAANVAHGATYKEVARTLGLSPATVRNHMHSAYAKLGTHSKLVLARCSGAEMHATEDQRITDSVVIPPASVRRTK